jgi:hypothetical protein
MSSWNLKSDLRGKADAEGRRKRVYTEAERLEIGRNRGNACDFHHKRNKRYESYLAILKEFICLKLKCDPTKYARNKVWSKNDHQAPEPFDPPMDTSGQMPLEAQAAAFIESQSELGIGTRKQSQSLNLTDSAVFAAFIDTDISPG